MTVWWKRNFAQHEWIYVLIISKLLLLIASLDNCFLIAFHLVDWMIKSASFYLSNHILFLKLFSYWIPYQSRTLTSDNTTVYICGQNQYNWTYTVLNYSECSTMIGLFDLSFSLLNKRIIRVSMYSLLVAYVDACYQSKMVKIASHYETKTRQSRYS